MERNIGMLGAGSMGEALIRGLLTSRTVVKENLRASDPRRERLDELQERYGIVTHDDNADLVRWANVVVIAVKPQVIGRVLARNGSLFRSETLVISVAAGVPLSSLEASLPSGARVVRAMPNTPATVLAGATALAPGRHATREDLELAKTLFDAVGRTILTEEAQINAVTGLSGSGPAYVMLVIEALADGGVQMGLPRDMALLMAAQTVYGSAKLLLESGEHPAHLKDRVASPGGTTIAGIYALEGGGLRGTLMDAVVKASQRAAELGRKS